MAACSPSLGAQPWPEQAGWGWDGGVEWGRAGSGLEEGRAGTQDFRCCLCDLGPSGRGWRICTVGVWGLWLGAELPLQGWPQAPSPQASSLEMPCLHHPSKPSPDGGGDLALRGGSVASPPPTPDPLTGMRTMSSGSRGS